MLTRTVLLQNFKYSILFGVIGVIAGFIYGGLSAVVIVILLSILEISLSFDNAVVNANILKKMDAYWQKLFLTVGILVAVFGMRLLFPILIVSVAADLSMVSVVDMAMGEPELYAKHLTSFHSEISSFGGMFLLLVFFSFLFDEKEKNWLDFMFNENMNSPYAKRTEDVLIRVMSYPAAVTIVDFMFNRGDHFSWIGWIEKKLAQLGALKSAEVIAALCVLLLFYGYLPEAKQTSVLVAGISGVILFVLINSLSGLFEDEQEGEAFTTLVKRGGLINFFYLEVLDASFSFDGVIGAFAITTDIFIIMLGLAIGALFIRSLTVYLVRQGTLDEYAFLEHGALYAIGALAFLMLFSMIVHIPELVTGLIGVTFIGLSIMSSIKLNKLEAA